MKLYKPISSQAQKTSLLIAIPSLAALVGHAYLGSFSRWMADDYCSAAEAVRLGILRAAWFWLRTWNGRYTADVLDAFFGVLGPAVTPVVTSIVLVVWLSVLSAAASAWMQRVAPGGRTFVPALATAAVILFVVLALAPMVPQSLYWGQGMRSVVPPLILITMYVALLAWCGGRHWRAAGLGLLAGGGFLLIYGAGGFSETFTAFQLAAFSLAVGAWFMGARRRMARAESLVLWVGMLAALLAFLTMVASPGNAGRRALLPPPASIPEMLRISADGFASFLGGLLGSPLKWTALAAAIGLGLWLGAVLHVPGSGWRQPILIIAAGIVLVFSCFPPAAYGTSQPPFDRTLIIPVYVLVATLLLLGISLANAPFWRLNVSVAAGAGLAVLLTLGVALSIAQMAEARPEYARYAAAWSRFHAQMIAYQRASVSSVYVETTELKTNNWASLDTIGDNPKFWLNKCVSAYYHVNVTSSRR